MIVCIVHVATVLEAFALSLAILVSKHARFDISQGPKLISVMGTTDPRLAAKLFESLRQTSLRATRAKVNGQLVTLCAS